MTTTEIVFTAPTVWEDPAANAAFRQGLIDGMAARWYTNPDTGGGTTEDFDAAAFNANTAYGDGFNAANDIRRALDFPDAPPAPYASPMSPRCETHTAAPTGRNAALFAQIAAATDTIRPSNGDVVAQSLVRLLTTDEGA